MEQLSDVEVGYLKVLDENLQRLKDLYPLDSKNQWKIDSANKDVTIHSQMDDKTGLKIVRAQIRINAPKEKVIEIVDNPEAILQWDKTLDDIKMLKRTKDYYIVHTIIKKLPLIVQRESILLAKLYFEGDVIYGVGCSLDYPDVPTSEYKVRATAYLVAWVLKTDPNNPNQTEYTYILHINPEGWIPNKIFNWFAHGQGFNVKPFAEYAEKRWQLELEERKKQGEKKKEEVKENGESKDVKETKENLEKEKEESKPDA